MRLVPVIWVVWSYFILNLSDVTCEKIHGSSTRIYRMTHVVNQERNDTPAFHGCETNLVPSSSQNATLKSYIINLDLPPRQRWSEVVKDKKEPMLSLLQTIRDNAEAWFGKKMFQWIDKYFPKLASTLPSTYYEELEGMAEAIGVELGDITLFNVFYEFFTVCTSIVAQTHDGSIYHARNLDFGIFLGWDIANKTWLTTEKLRPLVIELDFQRNNKTVFKTVNFAGFMGVLTGMKPNKFSLTINERFVANGGFIGVVEWMFGNHKQQWISFLTRDVMENADNYNAAQKMLAKQPLVAPVYFILSGTKPFEGCIITRGRNDFDIKGLTPQAPWFLVQTNSDHWKHEPFYDDRRTPATVCMNALGRSNLDSNLYNVLSTRPVLNKLTVYTTIIQPDKASMSTWIQNCEEPCWPW